MTAPYDDARWCIASQLSPSLEARIRQQLPEVEIERVETGVPTTLPAHARVLFAAPDFARRTALPVPAEWRGRVRWIQLQSAGADGYPPWYFDGPVVTCARGPTARTVAEFAIATIFAAAKELPTAWVHAAKDWRRTPLRNLEGATLGIAGYGAIGQCVGRLGEALGMRVVFARRSAELVAFGEQAPIEEVVAQADHFVVAAAATPATRHLVDARLLARAKPGLHLVNVARGSLVQQDDLLAAIEAGRIGRASLDVTEPEPLPEGHPFYSHPKVFVSSHISANDPDYEARMADLFVANTRRYLAGEALVNRVDPARGY